MRFDCAAMKSGALDREQDLILLHLIAQVRKGADDAALIRREHRDGRVLVEIDVADGLLLHEELALARRAPRRSSAAASPRASPCPASRLRRRSGLVAERGAARAPSGRRDAAASGHPGESEQGGSAARIPGSRAR